MAVAPAREPRVGQALAALHFFPEFIMSLTARKLIALLSTLCVLQVQAAETEHPDAQTVEFSAEASRGAPNDLAVAILFAERSGPDAASLAQEVNRSIDAALETARGYGDVKVQSAGAHTWPVYAENGNGRIEGWRMRSEIRLESRDLTAVSTLIGKLQASLALSQVSMHPAPETRSKAADEATIEAIRAFEQRATLIAGALGKRYRLRHMAFADGGFHPPMRALMRAAPAMMAEATPAPLEGGESEVSVSVSGRIELID